MNRRGFLQCLGAVSAAFAAGVRLPPPVAAAPVSPQQSDLVATVLEMLKHCRPISYERSESMVMWTTHKVEYLYDPKKQYRAADLSEIVGDFPKTKKPISIVVSAESESDTRLGQPMNRPAPRYTIEVVWA